jgi:adenylate kinase
LFPDCFSVLLIEAMAKNAIMDNRPAHRPGRVIVFLGAPGSGKGTQSSCLSERLGIPRMSTGDLLRAEASQNTAAGKRLKHILSSGALVSDDTVCAAVTSRLRRGDLERGVILDGFPRTVNQARYLDRLLEKMRLPRPLVLHLEISRERLAARLAARRQCSRCGAIFNLQSRPSHRGSLCEYDGGSLFQRDDDNETAIARRMDEFEVSFKPLLSHYAGADYYRIDADREPTVISADLLSITRFRQSAAA